MATHLYLVMPITLLIHPKLPMVDAVDGMNSVNERVLVLLLKVMCCPAACAAAALNVWS